MSSDVKIETREDRMARMRVNAEHLGFRINCTQQLIRQLQDAVKQQRKFRCCYDRGKSTECTYSASAENMHTITTSSAKMVEVIVQGGKPLDELLVFCFNHRVKLKEVDDLRQQPVGFWRLEQTMKVICEQATDFIESAGEKKRAIEEAIEREEREKVRVEHESSPEQALAELLGIQDLGFRAEEPTVVPFGEQVAARSSLIPPGMEDRLKERVGNGNGKTKKVSKKAVALSDAEALAKANALSPEDQRPS